jgi:hypothetical protein
MSTMTEPAAPSVRPQIVTPQAGSARAPGRRQKWFTIIFAIVIFIPCALGFGNKFVELVQLSHGDAEGRFALTPVINYLLATLGFLCMFAWGALRGTFHNVEDAKQKMLDDDKRIDEASRYPVA